MGFARMAGILLGLLQDGTSWPMVLLHGLFATLAFAAFHLLRRRSRSVALPATR